MYTSWLSNIKEVVATNVVNKAADAAKYIREANRKKDDTEEEGSDYYDEEDGKQSDDGNQEKEVVIDLKSNKKKYPV